VTLAPPLFDEIPDAADAGARDAGPRDAGDASVRRRPSRH
jgi:hypothetical protein